MPAPCFKAPFTCGQDHIAPLLDLKWDPAKREFVGRCPNCGRRGFGLAIGDRTRFYWSSGFCPCDEVDDREAMVKKGVGAGHLGGYASQKLRQRERAEAEDPVRKLNAIAAMLVNPELRNPADFRISLAEVLYGPAPDDFTEFRKFAQGRAGVGSTQSKEAAARWCRPAGSKGSSESQVGKTAGQTKLGAVGNRPSAGRNPTMPEAESDQRTSGNESDRPAA